MTPKMLPRRPYLLRAMYQWIVDSNCTPYVLVNPKYKYNYLPDQFKERDEIVFNISPLAARKLSIEHNCMEFFAHFSNAGESRVYLAMAAIQRIYAAENGYGI